MRVEICANSYESAVAAQRGGAHRIELCEHLVVGGLTPSESLIETVTRTLAIPVHVLLRPRAGDFVYSEEEQQTMLRSIEDCRKWNCAGVVVGALTSEKKIDSAFMKEMVATAEGMHITFHRAFDHVAQPEHALEDIIALGIHRILTSGQQQTAWSGLPLLSQLLKQSQKRIEIMPGAGIEPSQIERFKSLGFQSVHLSGIQKKEWNTTTDFFNTGTHGTTDERLVRRVVQLASQ